MDATAADELKFTIGDTLNLEIENNNVYIMKGEEELFIEGAGGELSELIENVSTTLREVITTLLKTHSFTM